LPQISQNTFSAPAENDFMEVVFIKAKGQLFSSCRGNFQKNEDIGNTYDNPIWLIEQLSCVHLNMFPRNCVAKWIASNAF
jgi:hypothetical protein